MPLTSGPAICHSERETFTAGLCRPCYNERNAKPAMCHPEKRMFARGLCQSCYKAGADSIEYPRAVRRRPPGATPVCHPERRHVAKDLCASCYLIHRTSGVPVSDFKGIGAFAECCSTCGSKERLSVDHCHEGNFVRGILCANCNSALGLAGDDPDRLRALADYVEANRRG